MDMSNFVVIGENMHCTRIIKAGGKSTVELPGGVLAVAFKHGGADRTLPIPADWVRISPAFGDGKIKHVALAIHQALHGAAEVDRQAGLDYLVWAAKRQVDTGAAFLDVNVDEYSNDPAEQASAMTWLAGFLAKKFDTPLSIDSSKVTTVVAGLEACRAAGRTKAMVNSVSLERQDLVGVIRQYGAEAVVSAAGERDLPTETAGRLANFDRIVGMLDAAGVGRAKMHLDPLVFPVSTEPMHGKNFLDATSQARQRFAGARLSGGFSNVSFGMPQRKLLNMVFVHMAAEAGASSGIIDPVQMPVKAIAAMDEQAEPYRLAKAFLAGEDMFGMEFITAHREGKLGAGA
jgi:5-methyltetrahydrofolate--homocysteine methyltransferase